MSAEQSSAPGPGTRPVLLHEELLTLAEAVRRLPVINGKRHSPSTLWRWCRYGINGVRLEHVRVGRKLVTSCEAMDRFFAALTEAAAGPAGGAR